MAELLQTLASIQLIWASAHSALAARPPAPNGDKEPFVSGADDLIDLLVGDIPNAEDGFSLIFSATPCPGFTHLLEWKREEYGGNWYFSPQFEREGWLCPALFKYFDGAPPRIHAKAEGIAGA